MIPEGKIRFKIKIPPWISDHRIQDRVVMPAVLMLHEISLRLGPAFQEVRNADFLRFLGAEGGRNTQSVDVVLDIKSIQNDEMQIALISRIHAGRITRTLTHMTAIFGTPTDKNVIPPELAAAPEGPGICVPESTFYKEIIPFGPVFHNVHDPVFITPGGATGKLTGPGDIGLSEGPLGCPFILDAAFHLCSAWTQRYHGVRTIPVGFKRLQIVRPARCNEALWARVIPAGRTRADDNHIFSFDCYIHDNLGNQLITCQGVRMRPLTDGQWRPPQWFCAKQDRVLDVFDRYTLGTVVMESGAVTPVAKAALTPREQKRFNTLGAVRARSFLGARTALKTLARRLGNTKASIQTLDADMVRPIVDIPGIRASASHDNRFVFAAAATVPIGVDVEQITPKALRGGRLFLDPTEQGLAGDCEEIATRIWTIKEAAAKAMNWHLARSWSLTRVQETNAYQSRVLVDGRSVIARHVKLDNHIFTVLTLGEAS